VFAPETAAHSLPAPRFVADAGAWLPGSGTAAILLGGLMVWGLNPRPVLFVEHQGFRLGPDRSMYLGNVVGLVLVLTTVPIFASILRGRLRPLAPMYRGVVARSAPMRFRTRCSTIWLIAGLRVVGYVFKKIGIRWRRSHWRWCSAAGRGCIPVVR